MRWVKCTTGSGATVHINTDLVMTLVRLGNEMTRVAFLGGEKSKVDVRETPEHIIKVSEGVR